LAGNTTVAGNYIGTNNSEPFLIYTNGVQQMEIDSSGNIGIGIGSSSYIKIYNYQSETIYNANGYIGLYNRPIYSIGTTGSSETVTYTCLSNIMSYATQNQTNSTLIGVFNSINIGSLTATGNALAIYGIQNTIVGTTSPAYSIALFYGIESTYSFSEVNNFTTVYGIENLFTINGPTNVTITNLIVSDNSTVFAATGTVVNFFKGLNINLTGDSSTVTLGYGIYVSVTSVTSSQFYGLYLANLPVTGTVYAIYNGTGVSNYFGSSTAFSGFNVSVPLYTIDLAGSVRLENTGFVGPSVFENKTGLGLNSANLLTTHTKWYQTTTSSSTWSITIGATDLGGAVPAFAIATLFYSTGSPSITTSGVATVTSLTATTVSGTVFLFTGTGGLPQAPTTSVAISVAVALF